MRKQNSAIKILLVDDELPFCQLMQRILQESSYNCSYVTSGFDALEKLRQELFDLLITDINMPEMGGLELIEKVHSEFPALAVLVTSGVTERATALKAFELGAYGYLLKPSDPFEVTVCVDNALRRAELEKLAESHQHDLETQVAERTEELVETNRLLQQQEKLASIGQLAAGIAHEIKTPTSYVSSNLGSLEKYLQRLETFVGAQGKLIASVATDEQKAEIRKLARGLKIDWILEDAVDLVRNCQEGSDRIKEIIKGLRDFSRQEQAEKIDFDLSQVLEDSLLLVHNELKYKAEVSVKLTAAVKVHGYPQRLSQVFINLLVNAAHAIKERGQIKVTSDLQGDEVLVKITDNGCGIPKKNLAKIFEAFYTTKEIGVGTGLGLSIVKDIIEQHHGDISVESVEGSGTVFNISLPIVATS